MTYATQNATILALLRAGGSITVRQAVKKLNINSLPRRILDLKEAGHAIEGDWINTPTSRYKRYYLGHSPQQPQPQQQQPVQGVLL